jgi:hypothetical protein
MTTTMATPPTVEQDRLSWVPGARRAVGCFYLFTAGVHLGIVAADTEFYRSFAATSPWRFVRDGWSSVFMAQPTSWGLALMAGEAALGVLLLRGGRAARVGWVGVITFNLLLMIFGWGFLFWTVPVLVLLVPVARADWPRLAAPAAARG